MTYKYDFEWDDKHDEHKQVTVVLADYAKLPGGVSRNNIGNIEGQVWAALSWGLLEPEHWPVDSQFPGERVWNDIPTELSTKCYIEWQKASGL